MMFDLKTLNGMAPESFMKKFNEQCPGKRQEDGVSLHLIEVAASPRILKCHYPLTLLPQDILDKTKVRLRDYHVSRIFWIFIILHLS